MLTDAALRARASQPVPTDSKVSPLLPAHYTDWQTFLEPALVRKLCGMEGDVFADMCSDLQVNAQSLVIYTSGCGPSSPSAVLCLVLSLALSVYACVFV